ncbi:MAG: hypothetical protein JO035_09210 [Betaproteobacteria bacterium]|nr:hypothetical protein [Betaproteobacteria bacterium]
MTYDWSKLREPAPGKLVAAREAAHWAAQALTKAARANLDAKPDDSHSALVWDAHEAMLVTQPLPLGVVVGLDVAKLELVVLRGGHAARRAAPADAWLDEELRKSGLKPASGTSLPYDIPRKDSAEKANLAALARWFAASAEALEEARAKHAAVASPLYLWPHHFDIATLLSYPGGKSIGVGISMSDHYYAQPYLYVSVYPAPADAVHPTLPAGHCHTKDFFGAVATADELLAQRDPRAALVAVIDAAVDQGRRWLHG